MQMLQEQSSFLGQLGLDNSIGTMHAPSVVAPPTNQAGSKEKPQANGAPGASNFQAQKLMFNNSVFNTYNYLHPEAASLMAAKSDTSAEMLTKKSELTSTPKRSNAIYETQLMCKGRGFPLWVPQPNIRLPVSQRAKGVSIGDVGIITEYGAFDFLFNICIPADDPINPPDLPEGFTTLTLKAWDVREFRDFPNGSYLASPSVGKAVKGDDRRVTTFESSAEESALLSMPEGAYHEEVNDLSKFRDYAEKHVQSWYDFVLHYRSRKDTANGDIRLVVGVDKSTSWGIASFSDPFKLQLKETEDPAAKMDCPYTWEHTGRSGEVKAGPDSCDNEDVCSTGGGKIRNQTLFVRTLNILLAQDVWDEIQKPKEVVDRDGVPECGVSCISMDIPTFNPSLAKIRPRLLKRPALPDEEDEYRPRTKSPRLSLDETMVYLRRILAQGFHDPESTGTLQGEHIPVYSETEKKIKYKWMKGSHESLTTNPPVLRNPWKVPTHKANEVAVEPSAPARPEDEIPPVSETSQRFDYIRSSRGSSAVAHLAPPEYRKKQLPSIIPLKSLPSTSQPPNVPPVAEREYSLLAHHPSNTSTIPTSTTEQSTLEMRKKIHEILERGESLSYSSLAPWSVREFAWQIQKANADAEPSTLVQPDDDLDSDDGFDIGSGYQYRSPMRPLNISKKPQPRAPTAEEYRRPIAGPLGQPRSRREKFEDLRTKAHEERMKPGSSSHVSPQGATVQTQSISYKGDDVVLPPCSSPSSDDELIDYEDEWSPTEDSGWVKLNLKSQPNKREVSPQPTVMRANHPKVERYSVVDSPSPLDWPRSPSVEALEAQIKKLKHNQERRLVYGSKTNSQVHEDLLFASSMSSGINESPPLESVAEKPDESFALQQPRLSGGPYQPRAEPHTEFELLDSTKVVQFNRAVESSWADDEPDTIAPPLKHLRDTDGEGDESTSGSVHSQSHESDKGEAPILERVMVGLEKHPQSSLMALEMLKQLKAYPGFSPPPVWRRMRRRRTRPEDNSIVPSNVPILNEEDDQPSSENSTIATASRSLEGPVDGGSPMNCDTDNGLSTVMAPGVNEEADGSNGSRHETLPEMGHEADMDPPPQHSSKSGSLLVNMLARLQPSAGPTGDHSGPNPEEPDNLLEHLRHGQRTMRFHRRDGSNMSLIRSEITSERHIDATRLGPRQKIQFDARRDLDNGATSNWGLREGTPFKHPSLAINSWILGAARLPSSVKMAITHDSAWYGILDNQSLRRAYRVRLAIEHQELETTDSEVIQSLYSICVTPAKTAMYLEPKEKRGNADLLGAASHVEVTVAAIRADGTRRAVFEYLLGPHGLLQSSSANFDFGHRQLQISELHRRLLAQQRLAAPSMTFDSLQLLDYHPARPVTIEVLWQVLNEEITAKAACDRNSVGELRKALQTARNDENLAQQILRKLANALLNRAIEFSDKDSIEEAIFYYQYLEPSTPTESMEYLELVLGLCTAHYLRYQLLRMREDLDSLFGYLDIQSGHNFGATLRRLGERWQDCS